MCVKAVNTYSFVFDPVPDQYKSQEMWNKAADDNANALEFVPDQYKTQEMCDRVVSEDSFSIRYVPDQCKTQKICDKVVDDFLPALKFVPDWFVTSKMIKKLSTDWYAGDILGFNENSVNVAFRCNEMGVLSINRNNINLDDTNYEENDPDNIILVSLWLGIVNWKNAKHLKRDKSRINANSVTS